MSNFNGTLTGNANLDGATYASPLTIGTNGSIFNNGAGDAVYGANGGDALVNQGKVNATGTGVSIGHNTGVYLQGAGSTVNNSGSINSTAGNGIWIRNDGSVTNDGTITGGIWGIGLDSGYVNNSNHVSGDNVGINVLGNLSLVNSGTITGLDGVYAAGAGSISNSGSIVATYGAGLALGGGAVTNTSSGFIESGGTYAAINETGAPATIVNDGTLTGYIGLQFTDIYGDAVTDTGAINGTGGAAVSFGSGNDRLIFVSSPTVSITGTVDGGSGTNSLEFASAAGAGTLTGTGADFVNFSNGTIDSGAYWTFAGTNTIGSGTTLTNDGTILDTGTLTVTGYFANSGSLTGPGYLIIDPTTFNNTGYLGVATTLIGGSELDNSGTVAVTGTAVYGDAQAETVFNTGSIAGTGPNGIGLYLPGGGYVVDGTTSYLTASISGYLAGMSLGDLGQPTTVANHGTVSATGTSGSGIILSGGGFITDANSGLITGDTGILLNGYNASTLFIYGTVSGGTGISEEFPGNPSSNAAQTIIDSGTIIGTAGAAIYLDSGDDLLQLKPGSLEIQGTVDGGGGTDTLEFTYVPGYVGTLTGIGADFINFTNGTIDSSAVWEFAGINTIGAGTTLTNDGLLNETGSLVNAGSISGPGYGLQLASGAYLENLAGAYITSSTGVGFHPPVVEGLNGGPSTVSNLGTIVNSDTVNGSAALYMRGGGTVTNAPSALLEGYVAIYARYAPLTVINSGTIEGDPAAGASVGIILDDGGNLTNNGTSLIAGQGGGAYFFYPGTIINYGTIQAAEYSGLSVYSHVTIIDHGKIEGGTLGFAVNMIESYNRLELYPGAVLTNGVSAGGSGDVLELASSTSQGTIGNFYTNYIGIGTITVDSGAQWVLSGNGTLAYGVTFTNGGTLSIDGTFTDEGGDFTNNGSLIGSGSLVIDPTTFTNTGYLGVATTLTGGSELYNSGTIKVAGTAVLGGPPDATVVNTGSIAGTGLSGTGVYLFYGGYVTNGSAADTTASITGHLIALSLYGLSTVSNYGTIEGTGASSDGVAMDSGTLVNGPSGSTAALIEGGGGGHSHQFAAVYVAYNGVITNYGTLLSSGSHGTGVFLGSGGEVTNGQASATAALIQGGAGGIYAYAASATITNYGTIAATSSFGTGIDMLTGTLVNGPNGATGALIAGGKLGVFAYAANATIFNYGTVTGTADGGSGVVMYSGTLVNGSTGATTALIEGGSGAGGGTYHSYGNGIAAVYVQDGAFIANYGTLTAGAPLGAGVALGNGGGEVNNGEQGATGALIQGGGFGIYASGGAPVGIYNYGTVSATGPAGIGIFLGGDGVVEDGSHGQIGGADFGIELDGTASSTLFIYGTVTGGTGIGQIYGTGTYTGDQTIIDSGTIIGTAGTAISFDDGADLLQLRPGNLAIAGTVAGGSDSTLELASAASHGTLTGLGTGFVNFTSGTIDFGAYWVFAGSNTIGSGMTLANRGYLDDAGTLVTAGSISGAADSLLVSPGAYFENLGGGYLTVNGYSGGTFQPVVYGKSGGPSTINNLGIILNSSTSSNTVGVYTKGGGTVTNGPSGGIGGVIGIYAEGSPLTVVNSGTVAGNPLSGFSVGINLAAGGDITNSGASSLIEGQEYAIKLQSAGTITNFGTIDATDVDAVDAQSNATVIDHGTIEGGAYGAAVLLEGTSTRLELYPGAYLHRGARAFSSNSVLEFASAATEGTIGSLYSYSGFGTITVDAGAQWALPGINGIGTTTTFINAGTLAITGRFTDIGTFINNGSLIGGGTFTVDPTTFTNTGYVGIVTYLVGGSELNNSGTIKVTGFAVNGGAPAETVVNTGTIEGIGPSGIGVNFLAGGDVTNGATTDTTATISGYLVGLNLVAASTVGNDGTIAATGTGGTGVYIYGGSLTNGASGSTAALIEGGTAGVYTGYGTVAITNYGTIAGTGSAGIGVFLAGGGVVEDASGGRITGPQTGIALNGYNANTLFIYGTVSGGTGIGQIYGTVYNTAAETIIASGTIIGTAGDAIQFNAGADLLQLRPGNLAIQGTVDGGTGNSTLEFASAASTGTLTGVGSDFVNFTTGTVDSGAYWVLAGSNTFASGMALTNYGTLAVAGTLVNGAAIGQYGDFMVGAGGYLDNLSTGNIYSHLGIGVTATGAATIVNAGRIKAYLAGVYLQHGGSFTNSATGYIDTHNGGNGVQINGSYAATVVNAGQIYGIPADIQVVGSGTASQTIIDSGGIEGDGINLGAGNDLLKLIASPSFELTRAKGGGGSNTLELTGTAGTLRGLGYNVAQFQTATVDLGAQWTLSKYGGATLASGYTLSDAGTLTNAATVKGDGTVIVSGSLFNQGSLEQTVTVAAGGYLDNTGSISANTGVAATGTVTIVNSGEIHASVIGIYLQHGGVFTNNAAGYVGGRYGVVLNSYYGATVVNAGTIAGNYGIRFAGDGTASQTIIDSGAITHTIDRAIQLGEGNDLVKLVASPSFSLPRYGISGGSGSNTLELAGAVGMLTGFGSGIVGFQTVAVDRGAQWTLSGDNHFLASYTLSDAGTLTNTGTAEGNGIVTVAGSLLNQGTFEPTVSMATGGYLNNTGSINPGSRIGIDATGAATIVNSGHIDTDGSGVYLQHGGVFTNSAGGDVYGFALGVSIIGSYGATIVNSGTIQGGYGIIVTGSGTAAQTIIDSGTFINVLGNNSENSIKLGAGNDLVKLIASPSFSLPANGADGGSGANTLELAGAIGTLTGLGSKIVRFQTVTVDSTAQWKLNGSNTLASGYTLTNAGTLTDTGTLTAAGTMINQGLLILSGSQTTPALLTQSGTLAGTVTFAAGNSNYATLSLTGAPSSTGTIAGFTGLHDVVDLATLSDANNDAVATLNRTTDILTITGDNGSVELQLDAENYNGASWIVAPDGNGGSNVIVMQSVPAVTESLADDTGASSTDNVTSDPELTGGGDPNTTVTITENGNTLGTATSNNAGTWVFTPSGLADGSHALVASETNAFGTHTASLSFTLDTTAPAVAITSSNGFTNQTTQTITGTVGDANLAANPTITLFDDGTQVGTTTASGGAWSASVTLSQGANSITAQATDLAGNTGTSNADALTLDTTAPVVAVDRPLLLQDGGTAKFPASLLQSTDNLSADAQLIYTVTTAPQDGTLLLNGAPPSSFTQADIDNGLLSYQETAPGASADSFAFTVRDAAGNTTATQQFDFDIASTLEGSQFGFFTPPGVALNVVFSTDGNNPPSPVAGVFNLEVITAPTQTSYPLPTGYQGLATFPGGTGKALALQLGDINVSDTGPADAISGGTGASTIGGGQQDTITGGTGNAFIDGTQGYESITGGGSGNETIFGGSGDTISGGGANVTVGGVRFDTLAGGTSTDFLDGTAGGQSITGGSAGNETIWGGAGDTISGGGAANETIGGAQGDTITGGTGTEFIDGSKGNQLITGGSAGNETIWGGAGDTIGGGSGASVTIGGAQGDIITGGIGTEFIDGSAGSQSITVGSAGNETIWGGNGDTITGGAADGLIGLSTVAGATAQFFSDSGTTASNSLNALGGFIQSIGDRILLNGAPVSSVLASTTTTNGNTTITFGDGSKLTLLGISSVNSTFFA